jgi:hypothetical protein
MHNWNLIFDSTTAQGSHQLRSQERFALAIEPSDVMASRFT